MISISKEANSIFSSSLITDGRILHLKANFVISICPIRVAIKDKSLNLCSVKNAANLISAHFTLSLCERVTLLLAVSRKSIFKFLEFISSKCWTDCEC